MTTHKLVHNKRILMKWRAMCWTCWQMNTINTTNHRQNVQLNEIKKKQRIAKSNREKWDKIHSRHKRNWRCVGVKDGHDQIRKDAFRAYGGGVNHGLTSRWAQTVVPLSLLTTSRFLPLPLHDHSQGVYFPPNRRRSIVFRVLFQQTNQQTNKLSLGKPSLTTKEILCQVCQSSFDKRKNALMLL